MTNLSQMAQWKLNNLDKDHLKINLEIKNDNELITHLLKDFGEDLSLLYNKFDKIINKIGNFEIVKTDIFKVFFNLTYETLPKKQQTLLNICLTDNIFKNSFKNSMNFNLINQLRDVGFDKNFLTEIKENLSKHYNLDFNKFIINKLISKNASFYIENNKGINTLTTYKLGNEWVINELNKNEAWDKSKFKNTNSLKSKLMNVLKDDDKEIISLHLGVIAKKEYMVNQLSQTIKDIIKNKPINETNIDLLKNTYLKLLKDIFNENVSTEDKNEIWKDFFKLTINKYFNNIQTYHQLQDLLPDEYKISASIGYNNHKKNLKSQMMLE